MTDARKLPHVSTPLAQALHGLLHELEDPVPAPGARVGAVLALMHEHGLRLAFDWPKWVFVGPADLMATSADLANAGMDDVLRVLTLHTEVERWVAGHLEAELRAGRLQMVLARLLEIVEAGGEIGLRAHSSGVRWRVVVPGE